MLEILTAYRITRTPRYSTAHEEDILMQVPEEIRKCVVFIGCKISTTPEHIVYGGTAFFVSEIVEDTGFVYLVTAKHNILKITEKSIDGKVYTRCNLKEGIAIDMESQISLWVFHPDPSVDVAVLPFIAPPKTMDYRPYDLISTATPERRKELGIGIGDEVFLPGLFRFHHGTNKNIPVIRVGNIAAMPEEPVQTANGKIEAYLIESRSIGGLSGSPVFVYLGNWRLIDKKWRQASGFTFTLLGLMHGHWDIDEADIDVSIPDTNKQRSINMGMAIVIPVEKILETIKQPILLKKQRELIDKKSAKTPPVPDIAVDTASD